MKTVSAPVPDEGKGGGSGAAPSPDPMMQEAIKHATAQQAAAPEGPRYGAATYGQAYYPLTDPATITVNEPKAREWLSKGAIPSERAQKILREKGDSTGGRWIQVARQGNPLFNEGLVAIADKDLYSRSSPSRDASLFRKYAETPELARLINAIVFGGNGPAIESNRTDIAGIFIPDLIKVDLSTGPVRVAGSGPGHPVNPDDDGYSRLSIFGGDTLTSAIQPGFGTGTIPGGWPNGRRFGDDVVDIAVSALISDLRGPLVIRVADGIDGVSKNDIGYNKVFPYASTPLNGRNHSHP